MRLIGFSVGDYAYWNNGSTIQRVTINALDDDESINEDDIGEYILQFTVVTIQDSKYAEHHFSTTLWDVEKFIKKHWIEFLNLPPDEMSRIYLQQDFKPAF